MDAQLQGSEDGVANILPAVGVPDGTPLPPATGVFDLRGALNGPSVAQVSVHAHLSTAGL